MTSATVTTGNFVTFNRLYASSWDVKPLKSCRNRKPYKKGSNKNGLVLWRGPSMLDGKPIVVIMTGFAEKSDNPKTGGMIQVWILREDMHPCEAKDKGEDVSICGDCPHRGKDCYVNVVAAPRAVWSSYARGGYADYSPALHSHLLKGKFLRLGAYGDPAAFPIQAMASILPLVKGWTGYTHQWRDSRFQAWKEYCMASADTYQDSIDASALGWRYFRVIPKDEINQENPAHYRKPLPRESGCPGSTEGGSRLTCRECKRCNGNTWPTCYNVVINNHFRVKSPLEA